MPKEQIRKRGKRKPKTESYPEARPKNEFTEAPPPRPPPSAAPPPPSQAGPSGLHPSRAARLAGQPYELPPRVDPQPDNGEGDRGSGGAAQWTRGPRIDPDWPFGELDPDLKAYFRNVEEQVKDWEGVASVGEEREDRQTFLTSFLTELRGHELQVATDPDCSVVLERLLPSLNDRGRRVMGDALSSGWEALVRNRWGSHVVQTWVHLAGSTLDREARGSISQQAKGEEDEETGILPTMSELVKGLVDQLSADDRLPQLLVHRHASPPIRLLFILLSEGRPMPALDDEGSMLRSKKSGKFRRKEGVSGKSILQDGNHDVSSKGKGREGMGEEGRRQLPEGIKGVRKEVRMGLMDKVGEGEWKSMGVDSVGSAVVQLLLDFEVEEGDAEKAGSLLDHMTEGLVSHRLADPTTPAPAQPYPSSLLGSQTGSHLFEALLRLAPPAVFADLWRAYFEGKIGKLAVHPLGNFVVAKGVSRLDEEGVRGVVRECQAVSGGRGLIRLARTSVLSALVERGTTLKQCQEPIIALVRSALNLPSDEENALVPCLLMLKTYPMYQALLSGDAPPTENDDADLPDEVRDETAEAAAAAAARQSAWENRRQAKPREGELVPSLQGCLLLQGMLSMAPGNEVILDSLMAQPVDALLEYTKSPIASHLLEAVLTNEAVPGRYRRKMILGFLGRYKEMAEDRMGSRVADKIWETADSYLREKVARSLIAHAMVLGNSQYGRYFVRKLDLWTLERRPDEWMANQAKVRQGVEPAKRARPEAVVAAIGGTKATNGNGEGGHAEKRKKGAKGEEDRGEKDEIDELFAGVEKKRKKSKKA